MQNQTELRWLIRALLLLVCLFIIFSLVGLYRLIEPLLP